MVVVTLLTCIVGPVLTLLAVEDTFVVVVDVDGDVDCWPAIGVVVVDTFIIGGDGDGLRCCLICWFCCWRYCCCYLVLLLTPGIVTVLVTQYCWLRPLIVTALLIWPIAVTVDAGGVVIANIVAYGGGIVIVELWCYWAHCCCWKMLLGVMFAVIVVNSVRSVRWLMAHDGSFTFVVNWYCCCWVDALLFVCWYWALLLDCCWTDLLWERCCCCWRRCCLLLLLVVGTVIVIGWIWWRIDEDHCYCCWWCRLLIVFCYLLLLLTLLVLVICCWWHLLIVWHFCYICLTVVVDDDGVGEDFVDCCCWYLFAWLLLTVMWALTLLYCCLFDCCCC